MDGWDFDFETLDAPVTWHRHSRHLGQWECNTHIRASPFFMDPKTWEKERILVFSSFLATTIHLKIALTTHDTDENPTCGQWIPNMWVCFSSRC